MRHPQARLDVKRRKAIGARLKEGYSVDQLKQAIDMIANGSFSPGDPHLFSSIVDTLLGVDNYLLLADYASYVACHDRVSALYSKPDQWVKKAILNVAGMGKFSSDRTITEYAKKIWHIEPVAAR